MRECSKCGKIIFESPCLIKECPICKKSFCNMCWKVRIKKNYKSFLCPICNNVLQEISEDDILESIRNSFSVTIQIEKNLSLDFSKFNGKINYSPKTGELYMYENLDNDEKNFVRLMYNSEVADAIESLDHRLMLRKLYSSHLTVDSACIPICHFNLR